jgi:hypothetical protein
MRNAAAENLLFGSGHEAVAAKRRRLCLVHGDEAWELRVEPCFLFFEFRMEVIEGNEVGVTRQMSG